MKWLSWKNFCFVIPPRFGCLIICLIETLWSILNFYLCTWVLLDNLKSFCLMEHYYTRTDIDYNEVKLASIGSGSAILSFICSMLLFSATLDDSKRNFLILIYILKNVCVIGANTYFFTMLFLKNPGDFRQLLKSNVFAAGAAAFDIIVPLYFGIIALFFYFDDDGDDGDDADAEDSDRKQDTKMSGDIEGGREQDTISLRKLNKPGKKWHHLSDHDSHGQVVEPEEFEVEVPHEEEEEPEADEPLEEEVDEPYDEEVIGEEAEEPQDDEGEADDEEEEEE